MNIINKTKEEYPLYSINLDLDNIGMWDNQVWMNTLYLNLAYNLKKLSKKEYKLALIYLL